MKKRTGKIIICAACAKDFYVPKYRIETAKFCSLECQNHKQYNKFSFNCFTCNKEVLSPPSRKSRNKRFCSLDCTHANRMSVMERRRKIKAIAALKRGSKSNRSLRRNVFLVKDKVCQVCNYDEYDFCLDVHHIDNDPTNNEIDNIAVLCCICHRKLHKGIISL